MQNTSTTQPEKLRELLAQRVVTHRADLVGRYQQVLRETLFINRAEVRPNLLKNIASDEIEALLSFLNQPALSVVDYGSRLHQIGLGERAILRLGQATRLFFLAHLENGQIAPMLEIVHTYQEEVIQGFVQGLEKYHLRASEHLRNNQQRGDS